MANFFSDNPDLSAQLEHIDLEEIVTYMENGFESSDDDDLLFPPPATFADAREFFAESLDLLGDITANVIAPRSQDIDEQGASLDDGVVTYADGTEAARAALSEAGFMGAMLPRAYGGAAVPATVYMLMIELVSRADGGLMTLFGYQDVGELIARFGTEAQGREFLPGLASGEKIGAIVLTEPGAGSDLQGIRVKATEAEDGTWRLNGTKHFISNGCGDVLMVLARSEEKISNIFGLSLFVCPKSDRVKVMRIEEKMGLHGSPTCELLFDDAPAQLIGRRKAGLTNYILESLAQARFSVAAQAIGIAEKAYQMALAYAHERVQFGTTIIDFPAVRELLDKMALALSSSRALLYDSVVWLDLKVQIGEAIAHGHVAEDAVPAAKARQREAAKYSNLLSPLVKYVITEKCQQVCLDAQQVFGGLGYMWETGVEQLVRDIRITTIYEGTSQVQVSASLKHISNDVLSDLFDAYEAEPCPPGLEHVRDMIVANRGLFVEYRDAVAATGSARLADAAARDLADIYSQLYGAWGLLRRQAGDATRIQQLKRYVIEANAFASGRLTALRSGCYDDWLDASESRENQ